MRGVGLLPENENTVHYVTAKICQGDIKHVFDYLITSHLLFWTHLSTGFLKQGQTVYQIFCGRLIGVKTIGLNPHWDHRKVAAVA